MLVNVRRIYARLCVGSRTPLASTVAHLRDARINVDTTRVPFGSRQVYTPTWCNENYARMFGRAILKFTEAPTCVLRILSPLVLFNNTRSLACCGLLRMTLGLAASARRSTHSMCVFARRLLSTA